MGTALVLERAVGEPVVVRPGDRVPDARIGNYRRLYRVDIANRGLAFAVSAPSSDPTFPFIVRISFACQVTDPVVIARDGVRDMTAALAPSLTTVVRDAAARFDVLQPAAAQAAITHLLNSAYPTSGVRLDGFAVTVDAADTAEIVTARREIRVQEMRRDAMRPVASGGRDEMLAHIMAMSDGDPTPLLDREQEAKDRSTQASLDALRVLMGSPTQLEDFNTTRISEQAMGTFFGDNSLLPPRRAGIRDRIERKSRGELESGGGQVIEEGVPEPPPDKEKPQEPGHRPSRVRGVPRSTED
jgi:hypothetical protein